jgi:hypothetical protein
VDGTTQDDAIAEFAIERPGTYALASAYEGGRSGPRIALAISRGSPEAAAAAAFGLLGAGLLLLAGLGTGLVTLLLRALPAAGPQPEPDGVAAALDRACAISRAWLPSDVHARVTGIRDEILRLLPHAAGVRERFVLRRTATDYLPTTLQAYLALPPAAASTVALREGKTALQLLREQLELLAAGVREVGDAVDARSSERFLVHGRFLELMFPQDA